MIISEETDVMLNAWVKTYVRRKYEIAGFGFATILRTVREGGVGLMQRMRAKDFGRDGELLHGLRQLPGWLALPGVRDGR
jgi:hypothetical protein